MDEVVYIYDPSYLGDRNGMTSVQGQLRPKKKKKTVSEILSQRKAGHNDACLQSQHVEGIGRKMQSGVYPGKNVRSCLKK
jgi:hypothetical protein